jgi:hypothetical protein
MARLVITHKVADVEKWLGFKSERAAAGASLGGTHAHDHVEVNGDNEVAISCEVDDVDAVVTALKSPPQELSAVMETHGVVPPLTVLIAR